MLEGSENVASPLMASLLSQMELMPESSKPSSLLLWITRLLAAPVSLPAIWK